MEILGYFLTTIIGICLGVIGGGGSILTVPILVYVFGITPELSTAYSLFIVGVTALAGSYAYYRDKLINIKAALVFAAPSLITVFATRKYLMPAIPHELYTTGNFILTKDILIMVVFAVLMIVASISMIRKQTQHLPLKTDHKFNYPVIFIEGAIVGVLTGFVGAGGGFLIIPALVLFAHLPIKEAVGTSLFIITIKSLIGFTGDLGAGVLINWNFLLIITAFTIVGILAGNKISTRISAEKLKPVFGWFVLIMGIFILASEIFIH